MRALRVAIVLSVTVSFSPRYSLSTNLSQTRKTPLPNDIQEPRLSLLSLRNVRPSDGALMMRGEKCRAVILKFIDAQRKQDREWLAYELADSVVRKLKASLDPEYCDPLTISSFEGGRTLTRGGRMRKAQIV